MPSITRSSKKREKKASNFSHIASCPILFFFHLTSLFFIFFYFILTEKRCILTITRPNGATRSYTSKPEFARKAEARAAAASIAVDMGAIDFIKYGSPEAVAKRGLVLAPLDAPGSVQEPSATDAEGDPAVKEIETCCAEWRAGRVKPCWIFLIDSKPTGSEHLPRYIYISLNFSLTTSDFVFVNQKTPEYGCALQIKLSLHLFRVCSVDVVHPSFEMAKAACAADAISEGILDFIMFGNGQTAPAEKRLFEPQQDDATSAAPPITLTLQGFFEALPRPLPEPVDDKTVAEINAPGWLNTLIQSARGGKFEHKFIWTTDTKLGSMLYSLFPLSPYSFKAVYNPRIAHQLFPLISSRRRSATYSPW